ncbi:uncharacterized protein LOC143250822 isoform X2 [Tachypleus tridentatus]|uniref:uncharacterized protein LOC143250822 isoform X2 n=1 Tax=Tachypleus tridentatus TaxID=6853 RepID=UPI003FD5080A
MSTQPTPETYCDSVQSVSATANHHSATAAATAPVYPLPPSCDSRLLPPYPRLAGSFAMSGLFGTTYPDSAGCITALGPNAPTFYTSLTTAEDLKDRRPPWSTFSRPPACYTYDPALAAYTPYGDRYGSPMDGVVARKKNATRETTNTLKAWLYEHKKNPYPTKGEKIMLAIITKMTLTQVSTWFANARRRLKKENKMTWEPKNKLNESSDMDEENDDLVSVDETAHNDVKTQKLSEKTDKSRKSHDVIAPQLTVDGKSEDSKTKERVTDENCNSIFREDTNHPSPQHLSTEHEQFTSSSISRMYGLVAASPNSIQASSSGSHNSRPKIWSLARTATSNSPPCLKRPSQLTSNSLSALKCPSKSNSDIVLSLECPPQVNSENLSTIKHSAQTKIHSSAPLKQSRDFEPYNSSDSDTKERLYRFTMTEGFTNNNGLVSSYPDHWNLSPASRASNPTNTGLAMNCEARIERVMSARVVTTTTREVTLPYFSAKHPNCSLDSEIRESAANNNIFSKSRDSLPSQTSYEYRRTQENGSSLNLNGIPEVVCSTTVNVRNKESHLSGCENYQRSFCDNIGVTSSLS